MSPGPGSPPVHRPGPPTAPRGQVEGHRRRAGPAARCPRPLPGRAPGPSQVPGRVPPRVASTGPEDFRRRLGYGYTHAVAVGGSVVRSPPPVGKTSGLDPKTTEGPQWVRSSRSVASAWRRRSTASFSRRRASSVVAPASKFSDPHCTGPLLRPRATAPAARSSIVRAAVRSQGRQGEARDEPANES